MSLMSAQPPPQFSEATKKSSPMDIHTKGSTTMHSKSSTDRPTHCTSSFPAPYTNASPSRQSPQASLRSSDGESTPHHTGTGAGIARTQTNVDSTPHHTGTGAGIARTQTASPRLVPECAAGLPGGSLEISKPAHGGRRIPKSLTTVPEALPASDAGREGPCDNATWQPRVAQERASAGSSLAEHHAHSHSHSHSHAHAHGTGADAACDLSEVWEGLRRGAPEGAGAGAGAGAGLGPVPPCDSASSVALEFGALLLLLQMHPTEPPTDGPATKGVGTGLSGGRGGAGGEGGMQRSRAGPSAGAGAGAEKRAGAGARAEKRAGVGAGAEGGRGAWRKTSDLEVTDEERNVRSQDDGGKQGSQDHVTSAHDFPPCFTPQAGKPPGGTPHGGTPEGGVPAALAGPGLCAGAAPHDCLVVRFGPSSDAACLPPEVPARRTRKLQAMRAELEEILGDWAQEQRWKRQFEQHQQCRVQGLKGAQRVQGGGQQGLEALREQHWQQQFEWQQEGQQQVGGAVSLFMPAHAQYETDGAQKQKEIDFTSVSPADSGSLILAPSSSGDSTAAERAGEEASSLAVPPGWGDDDTCTPVHPGGPRQQAGATSAPRTETLGERLITRSQSREGCSTRTAARDPKVGHTSPHPQRHGEGQKEGQREGQTEGQGTGQSLPLLRRRKPARLLLCMGLAAAVEEGEMEPEEAWAGVPGGQVAVYHGHIAHSAAETFPAAESLRSDEMMGAEQLGTMCCSDCGEDSVGDGALCCGEAEHPMTATLCTVTSSLCTVSPSMCVGHRVVLVPTASVDCVEAVYRGVRVCLLAPGFEEYCDPTDEVDIDDHVDRIIGVVSEFHRTNYCEWPLVNRSSKATWVGA